MYHQNSSHLNSSTESNRDLYVNETSTTQKQNAFYFQGRMKSRNIFPFYEKTSTIRVTIHLKNTTNTGN